MTFDSNWAYELLDYLQAEIDAVSLDRGRRYARQGRVLSLSLEGSTVKAGVRGTRATPYRASLQFDSGMVRGQCSCPVACDCKHVAATAITVLFGASRYDPNLVLNVASHIPHEWRRPGGGPHRSVLTPLVGLLDGSLFSAPPDATADPSVFWWRAYLEADSSDLRKSILEEVVFTTLKVSRYQQFYWDVPLRNWARIENPVDALAGFGEFVSGMGTRFAGRPVKVVPDRELEAFLASEECARLRQAHDERIGLRRFVAWLSPSANRGGGPTRATGPPTVSGKIDFHWIEVPTSKGLPCLGGEVLLTSKRLVRAPRTLPAIDLLAREIANGTRVVAEEEGRFVSWVANQPQVQSLRSSYPSREERGNTVVPVTDVYKWFSEWGDSGMLTWKDGGAAWLSPYSARLTVKADEAGVLRWEVILPADGTGPSRSIPLRDTHLVADGVLLASDTKNAKVFLREGDLLRRLDTGAMPLDVLVAALKTDPPSVATLRELDLGRELVRKLKLLDPNTGDTGGLVREVEVRPRIELRYAGNPNLLATVRAKSETNGTEFLLNTFGSWCEVPRPAAAAEDGAATIIENWRKTDASTVRETTAPNVATREAPETPVLSEVSSFEEDDATVGVESPDEATAAGTEAAPAPDDEARVVALDGGKGGDDARLEPIPPPVAPPPSVEPLAVIPSPSSVAGVEAFVESFIPSNAAVVAFADGTPAFQWKIDEESFMRLLGGWRRRPTGIDYLGDPAFRDLVTLRRLPAFKISIEPSGTDWLSVSVAMEAEMESLSPKEIREALRSSDGKSELVALPGGRVYRRDELTEHQKTLEALAELGLDPNDIGTEATHQRLHAYQLAGGLGPGLAAFAEQEEAPLRELAREARRLVDRFQGIPAAAIPEESARELRPYQREGVDFLVWAWKTFGGAILADDMGLGKTYQVLAALNTLCNGTDQTGTADTVAVAPAAKTARATKQKSKAKGKKKDAKGGAGDAKATEASDGIAAAASAERLPSLVVCPASVMHNWERECRRFAPSLKAVVFERGVGRKALLANLDRYDVVITNYALARRDAEALGHQRWRLVCIDEAQAIKNPAADISRVVKTFESDSRIALTGTPIENRLLDLWSIVDFALPGFLGSRRAFEQRLREADPESLYAHLRAKMRPAILRRLKSEVAKELPPRIEEQRDCEMTAAQRKVYLAELKKTRDMLAGVADKRVIGKDRIQILAALTRLRQICCDPALLGLAGKGSGKVEATMDIVRELVEAGHKVLLFSQFVKMLERLAKQLDTSEIPYWMLTGKSIRRKELVDSFENSEKPGVFLISLKAGGTGLNLVSASHVILFDPWWNPAVEAQAIDRTHRIGQDKTVVAYRMIARETVEERILELQERKRGLVKNVLEEAAFNRALTREDFQYLLRES